MFPCHFFRQVAGLRVCWRSMGDNCCSVSGKRWSHAHGQLGPSGHVCSRRRHQGGRFCICAINIPSDPGCHCCRPRGRRHLLPCPLSAQLARALSFLFVCLWSCLFGCWCFPWCGFRCRVVFLLLLGWGGSSPLGPCSVDRRPRFAVGFNPWPVASWKFISGGFCCFHFPRQLRTGVAKTFFLGIALVSNALVSPTNSLVALGASPCPRRPSGGGVFVYFSNGRGAFARTAS